MLIWLHEIKLLVIPLISEIIPIHFTNSLLNRLYALCIYFVCIFEAFLASWIKINRLWRTVYLYRFIGLVSFCILQIHLGSRTGFLLIDTFTNSRLYQCKSLYFQSVHHVSCFAEFATTSNSTIFYTILQYFSEHLFSSQNAVKIHWDVFVCSLRYG